LNAVVNDLKPDIVLLSETWLNNESNEAFLQLDDYNLEKELRRDRRDTAGGIGGGLAVYTREGIRILPIDTSEDFNQAVKFRVQDSKDDLEILLIYRPPKPDQKNIVELTKLVSETGRNTIIIGDLNLPGVDWEHGECGNFERELVQTLEDGMFEQLVTFPTHLKGNILDVVLSNNPEKVGNVIEQGRVGRSDHVLIQVEVGDFLGRDEEKEMVRNWNRADWQKIRDGIEGTDWPREEDGITTEEAWGMLRRRLDDLLEENVPKTKFRKRVSEWMTRELLQDIRRKRRLWKKAKNGTREDKEEYEKVEKEVRNKIRSGKRRMERRLAEEEKKTSKHFYSYVRKKTKTRTGVGPLKAPGGNMVTEPEEMATMLNDFFASVFTRETAGVLPEPTRPVIRNRQRNRRITTEKVKKKIDELRPNSAAGPDGISPKILKNCRDQLAPVLAMIYRKSRGRGEVPDEWKQAHVVPI